MSSSRLSGHRHMEGQGLAVFWLLGQMLHKNTPSIDRCCTQSHGRKSASCCWQPKVDPGPSTAECEGHQCWSGLTICYQKIQARDQIQNRLLLSESRPSLMPPAATSFGAWSHRCLPQSCYCKKVEMAYRWAYLRPSSPPPRTWAKPMMNPCSNSIVYSGA